MFYIIGKNFLASVNNQISAIGYTYDAAGDLTADGNGNSCTYNADEMITASSGASYVYDALNQRVAKTGGSNAGETIYFNGVPIALHNPSSGAYTDLLYANGSMIAEVAGTQTAVATYRASDHLSSLALQTNNSGGATGSNTFLPFGQTLTETTADQFQFIGLPQDTENSSYHAGYRNLSYQQGRWLSPDPSNSSYDITNPQSFNRYSYVMNPASIPADWTSSMNGAMMAVETLEMAGMAGVDGEAEVMEDMEKTLAEFTVIPIHHPQ